MLGTALLKILPGATGIDIDDADITDREKIFPVIEKHKPDIVIHTAAYTNVDSAEVEIEKAYSINAIGTACVALVCRCEP